MTIQWHFDRIEPDMISGWAWDPDRPAAPVVVELFDGDARLGAVEASDHRPDLERAKFRGGRCAFYFRCPLGRRIADPARVYGVFRLGPAKNEGSAAKHKGRPDDGTIDFGFDAMKVLQPLGLRVEAFRGKLQFGAQTRFETPIVVRSTIRSGTNVEIGAFTAIYGGALHWCRIGRYCSFAAGAVIGPSEHAVDWLTTSLIAEDARTHDWHAFVDPENAAEFEARMPRFTGRGKGVSIGNDVWLGDGVFVRTGVAIGDGAVVGARSVVVGDIPPYAIAVGNPARVKRLRFPEPIVERLLKLRWWRFSLYDLLDVPFDRIEAAIDTIEERIAGGKLMEYQPESYTVPRLRQVLADKARMAAA